MSKEKDQLKNINDSLKSENKKMKDEIGVIQSQIQENNKEQQTLNMQTENLTKNVKLLEAKEEELKTKNNTLEKKQEDIITRMKLEKQKTEQYETQQKNINLDINKLLENKTFYSETLSGHKNETTKILFVSILFCFVILITIGVLLRFTYEFYIEAIAQIINESSHSKILYLIIARSGVGVLLYFAFRFLSQALKKGFIEMYNTFKGIRDIESSLILAREIAFSTEKDITFETKEERRNYLSFLKLSVLKNHFINLNSLKTSLQIKDEKLKQIE